MNTLRYLLLLALLIVVSPARAQELPDAEKTKIESLIKHVEELKDTKFIRNGREHDATTAGKFLRGKWKANAKDIHTASDFIDKAATSSGTTGKPYTIRLSGGEEVKCGEYLHAELKKLK